MFRDDEQTARACRTLLASVRRAELWTRSGPTPEALSLLERDGGPLSSGERIVLLAAFAFWNGEGGLRLTEVIDSLDVEAADALCSLLIAVKHGADAVDAWIVKHEPALRAIR